MLLLPGCEIVAATADRVKLRIRTGAVQTFYRCTTDDPCRLPLWELPP